jgi:hypothetical protein
MKRLTHTSPCLSFTRCRERYLYHHVSRLPPSASHVEHVRKKIDEPQPTPPRQSTPQTSDPHTPRNQQADLPEANRKALYPASPIPTVLTIALWSGPKADARVLVYFCQQRHHRCSFRPCRYGSSRSLIAGSPLLVIILLLRGT